MVNYTALYGSLLETATRQLYDRVFGQNQIHANIDNIRQVFEDFVSQGKAERIRVDWEGPFWLSYTAIGFVLGHDPSSGIKLTENVRFWGLRGGVSTVLTREGWYTLGIFDRHVIQSAAQWLGP